ncbi:hypothetical protein [Bosea sp. BK604]|uniref:hypothetical protein n=1 Tax=Bosea sp. BK604 TaxID=2512180 RepID=UPI00104FDFA0|nr:hypothetical protein [Bosea sp. BK604]TCR69697.1 hypothetical protein EV560_10194 [Bosea sp. BK604]
MSLDIRTEIRSQDIERMLLQAGARAPVGIARALNRAGVPTENAYLRVVKTTLGLRNHPYAKAPVGNVMKRRTSRRAATAANLVYSLAGFGRGLPAIYYQPKEAPAGASINWLGARQRIDRSFYLSAKFPRRKRGAISHAVWRRTGHGKWALDRPRGPGIPEAMTQDAPRTTWESQAAARLGPALASALAAVLRGY